MYDEWKELIPFTRQSMYNFVMNHDYFSFRDFDSNSNLFNSWLFFEIIF